MKTMTGLTAVRNAIFTEMEQDQNVFLMGEDVRHSMFGTSDGMVEAFGAERVRDTPLSEAAFVGTAVGAAMTGMRPVVDMSLSSFLYVAMDQIVSMAAKTTQTFGGQYKVPVVILASMLYGVNNAAQHSDRPYPMFMNVPGLKIVTPSCPSDTYGLLRTAIRDDDPVMIFTDASVNFDKEEVDEDLVVPLGKAAVKRTGTDVTIVGIAGCVPMALSAATELESQGISAEVIDPRTMVPLDKKTIIESVEKTGRLVIADVAHRTCSGASEIASIIAQQAFAALKGPIQIVATDDVPVPFSPALEPQIYPSIEKIIAAVKTLL